MPDWAARNVQGWRDLMPDWDVRVITEADRPPTPCEETYDFFQNPAARSDIDRVNLLSLYGGVYLDWDMVPVRPLDPILETGCGAAFASFSWPERVSGNVIENGFLAAEAGHPLLARWLAELPARLDADPRGPGFHVYDFVNVTMTPWTTYVDDYLAPETSHQQWRFPDPILSRDLLILPQHAFFPPQAGRPGSYAVHEWRHTWLLPPDPAPET